VEVDRVKRPTIAEVVDELNKIDTSNGSPPGQVYVITVMSSMICFFTSNMICLLSTTSELGVKICEL
jgi:hypothetical protein